MKRQLAHMTFLHKKLTARQRPRRSCSIARTAIGCRLLVARATRCECPVLCRSSLVRRSRPRGRRRMRCGCRQGLNVPVGADVTSLCGHYPLKSSTRTGFSRIDIAPVTTRVTPCPPMPALQPCTQHPPLSMLLPQLLLLLLVLLPLCCCQRVGELGHTLPPFQDKPGMLNCVR